MPQKKLVKESQASAMQSIISTRDAGRSHTGVQAGFYA
jgi:hypothetical protein